MGHKITSLNNLKYKICKFFDTDWQTIQEADCTCLDQSIQTIFLDYLNNKIGDSTGETIQFVIELWDPNFLATRYYFSFYRKDTDFYSLEELLKNNDKIICLT